MRTNIVSRREPLERCKLRKETRRGGKNARVADFTRFCPQDRGCHPIISWRRLSAPNISFILAPSAVRSRTRTGSEEEESAPG